MASGFAPTDYRPPGLGGFWGDLFGGAIDWGRDVWPGGPEADPIPEQERTQDELAAIDIWLSNGPQTVERINEAIRRVNRAADRFFQYATQPQFGERGRRGAFDVREYADEAILSLESQRRIVETYEPGGGSYERQPGDLDPEMIPGIPNWATIGVAAVVGAAVVPSVVRSMTGRK